MFSGYGIAFDGAGSWSFGNDFARNVVTFILIIVHHLILIDNRKNKFLVLGEGPAYGINGSFSSPKKKINTNFSKSRTNFCFSLHYNHDNIYLFVNRKEIFKFKANVKIFNFPTQFCLGNVSNVFGATESR